MQYNTMRSSPGAGVDSSFRPDIQALRAVAVIAVVLFHLWPHGLTGGYVGVDVFFAISGFLVTSHLLTEIDTTGRLRPARFWARRIKRLQPAALLVLLVTILGIVTFVPRNHWQQFLHEVVASTLQVENWLLAHNAVDYLASGNAASPAQHFWTLSVEEQFYFGLPLLLLAAIFATRGSQWRPRTAIAIILGLVTAASLVYSVWLTTATPSLAYFSTLTRAWEFASGALLALVTAQAKPLVQRMGPWVGIAAIGAACLTFDEKTGFPGFAAALPVTGTLLCLWCGRNSVLETAGRFAPVALVGRASYAIYLWHWPLLILAPYALGRPMGTVEKCGVLILSVVLAWASTRWVEDPVRFSPRLLGGERRPRTVIAWSLTAMAATIALALLIGQNEANHQTAQDALKLKVISDLPRCLGAQSMGTGTSPCENPELKGILVPSLSVAKDDDDNRTECWGSLDGAAKVCPIGSWKGYAKRLYAVGDSHNNTLIGVYSRIAKNNNWRIDVSGTGGCYLTMGRQPQLSAAEQASCENWRASVIKQAHDGNYDAIIVTHSSTDRLVVPGPGQTVEEATINGLAEAWQKLPNVPIIAIRDNPGMPAGTMDCVAVHGLESATRCAPSRGQALAFDGQEEAARLVARARYLDFTNYYCDETTCPPVIGHVLVYRDGRHLTATYAASMTPYMEDSIKSALTE